MGAGDERRSFAATFQDVRHTLNLEAGKGGIGAVVHSWTDPIKVHDQVVLMVEECMGEKRRAIQEHRYRTRVLANWEVAIGFIKEEPHKLARYTTLKNEMKNFERRYKRVTIPAEKIKLEKEWEEFCTMQPKFERILAAQEMYLKIKDECDVAQRALLAAGKELETIKNREREAADLITDDHISADQAKKGIGTLFPSIQIGYIMSKLHGIAPIELENKPFETILLELDNSAQPMSIEFRPYPYVRNMLTGEWESHEELRDRGVYVPDYQAIRSRFAGTCREGDMEELRQLLIREEDPNSADEQGCTGMHLAAANGHIAIMEVLAAHKADIEARNQAMETPLLYAIKRGNDQAASWLLHRNARLDTMDRARRTPFMHALQGKNLAATRLLMAYTPDLRYKDAHWGWTPLHYAAHAGFPELVKQLLDRRASPYQRSRAGFTPLDVAKRASQAQVVELIEAYLRKEPAHQDGESVWLGSRHAAYPLWATEHDFDAVLSIRDTGVTDNKLLWLEEDNNISYLKIVEEVDHDDVTGESWSRLSSHMGQMLGFIHTQVRKHRKLLIHCDSGTSTCVGIFVVYRLLKMGVGVTHSVQLAADNRPQVQLTQAIASGLSELQDSFDNNKCKRLQERVRTTPILSLGF